MPSQSPIAMNQNGIEQRTKSSSTSTQSNMIRLHIIALMFIASYVFIAANISNHKLQHHKMKDDSFHRQLLQNESYEQQERWSVIKYLFPLFTNNEEPDENKYESNHHLLLFDNDNDPSNKMCRNYLKKFLSGSTNVRDECEGLETAYETSNCQVTTATLRYERDVISSNHHVFYNQDNNSTDANSKNGNNNGNNNNKNDDFFEEFECCQVISHYYTSKCLYHQRYVSLSLLGVVSVLILCSLTKTILQSCTLISLQWLPEAGGCIIVGAIVSLIFNSFFSSSLLFDYTSSFNDELFMYILLPPIIFQASLSIHKKQFTKLLYPILMFAVFGTFLSSILIGYIVHYSTYYISDNISSTIPLLDSMLYGSLISSIDPVATLSILGSMGIATDHVLYVVVFGESILNDGVAIALFDSLKMHLEKRNKGGIGSSSGDTDSELVKESLYYFIKICTGSVGVGLLIGVSCTMYFWFLRGKQSPVMEVGVFFCFAFIAYYSADGLLGCSGIVSIMTAGFVMDIYVRGYKLAEQDDEIEIRNNDRNSGETSTSVEGTGIVRRSQQDNAFHLYASLSSSEMTTRARCCWENNFSLQGLFTDCKIMFSGVGHMSDRAMKHVGFVADVLANLMETSIFAYLGLFLFSNKKWSDIPLILIGVLSCVLSRMIMIGVTSGIVNTGIMMKNYIQSCFRKLYHQVSTSDDEPFENQQQSRFNQNRHQDNFYIDRNMQLVLLYSGVRGAVSLALVENIPLYDAVTQTGSPFKPALKAMTSSSIIFTVFFFGASTYFTLKRQRERINNATNVDAESQQTGGFIGGLFNGTMFHFDYNRHDLSLQATTGSRDSLTASLLVSDAAAIHEERYLPPWMRS